MNKQYRPPAQCQTPHLKRNPPSEAVAEESDIVDVTRLIPTNTPLMIANPQARIGSNLINPLRRSMEVCSLTSDLRQDGLEEVRQELATNQSRRSMQLPSEGVEDEPSFQSVASVRSHADFLGVKASPRGGFHSGLVAIPEDVGSEKRTCKRVGRNHKTKTTGYKAPIQSSKNRLGAPAGATYNQQKNQLKMKKSAPAKQHTYLQPVGASQPPPPTFGGSSSLQASQRSLVPASVASQGNPREQLLSSSSHAQFQSQLSTSYPTYLKNQLDANQRVSNMQAQAKDFNRSVGIGKKKKSVSGASTRVAYQDSQPSKMNEQYQKFLASQDYPKTAQSQPYAQDTHDRNAHDRKAQERHAHDRNLQSPSSQYKSTQPVSVTSYPVASDAIRNATANQGSTPYSDRAGLGSRGIVPRHIADTGKALSKGVHRSGSGSASGGQKNATSSRDTMVQSSQSTWKSVKHELYSDHGPIQQRQHFGQKRHSKNESLKQKYLNKGSVNMGARSIDSKEFAGFNHSSTSSQHQHPNQIATNHQKSQRNQLASSSGQVGGSRSKNGGKKQTDRSGPDPRTNRQSTIKINDSDYQPRMPFELANTFISNGSQNGALNSSASRRHPVEPAVVRLGIGRQAPQNSLAHKMQSHINATENDNLRKSMMTLGGSGAKPSERPSVQSTLGNSNANKSLNNQRISAKIPAKVRAAGPANVPQWQTIQPIHMQEQKHERNDFLEPSELSPGSRLKQNMQIYTMPKKAAGSGRGVDNSTRVAGAVGGKKSANGGIVVQPSQPMAQPRAQMPLANKYAYLGAQGLQSKEPNKFPSDLQNKSLTTFTGATQGPYHHHVGVAESAHKAASHKHVVAGGSSDLFYVHPMLSKSLSGVKKRPSAYQDGGINVQPLDEGDSVDELNDRVRVGRIEERKGFDDGMNSAPRHQERSDSYFGRIRNFLGFNRSELEPGISSPARLPQAQMTNLAKQNVYGGRDIMSEPTMSPQQPEVTKLTLVNLNHSEDYQPVSSQKFESPRETKQLSSHRFKCTCEPSPEPYACASAYKWLQMANGGRRFEIQKSRKSYLDLLGIKDFISMAEERQIECDITRTFPHQKIFQEREGEGQQSLQRVLQAFSKYDASIGYVQGMNFIVGALLLHCSEEVTFWLFVALIEDYEMRDIYMEGLPGHIKHSTLIRQLMETHLAALDAHLCDIGMNVEIFATDWYFTLFAKVIPTGQMCAFYDQFFEFGWCFFHKFTLTLLRILQPKILEMDDMSEIKQLLLLPKHKEAFYGPEGDASTTTAQSANAAHKNGEAPFDEQGSHNNTSNQRTFLSSIGSLFWPARSSNGSAVGSVDAQLQDLMGLNTVEDLLKREDAWVEIIHISKNLWGSKLPDAAIIQFLNDYDAHQEQQKAAQLEAEAKFNDSSDHINDSKSILNVHNRDDSAVIVMGEESSPLRKASGVQLKNNVHARGGVRRSFGSSGDLLGEGEANCNEEDADDDHLEYPTNELSPMKHVHDSGMRMPKQTKLMFQNMQSMRHFTAGGGVLAQADRPISSVGQQDEGLVDSTRRMVTEQQIPLTPVVELPQKQYSQPKGSFVTGNRNFGHSTKLGSGIGNSSHRSKGPFMVMMKPLAEANDDDQSQAHGSSQDSQNALPPNSAPPAKSSYSASRDPVSSFPLQRSQVINHPSTRAGAGGLGAAVKGSLPLKPATSTKHRRQTQQQYRREAFVAASAAISNYSGSLNGSQRQGQESNSQQMQSSYSQSNGLGLRVQVLVDDSRQQQN